MRLTEKARQWEEDYGFLPDPRDRFQYLIEQSATAPGLPETQRTAANRVLGCVSAVWVVAEREGETVRFRTDGDSPMVKALAWLLEDFYSGAPAAEIASTPPGFIDRLGLEHALTENRRRGLRALIERFQSLAREIATTPA